MATVEDGVEAWVWPAEVIQLAEEKGVAQYLEPMLEMTRNHFQNARRLAVSVDVDWEIPDERTILFEVEIEPLSADKYVQTRHDYISKSFEICPANLICTFGLRLIPIEI
ncbi:MAG: hypothetical protein ACJ8FY_15075 [Gemmataceae bacterium]